MTEPHDKTPQGSESTGADLEAVTSENESSDPTGTEGFESKVDPTLEWKAKVTYLSAEIENMRKRFAREKLEFLKHANESLVKSLLPVFDNLHLAVEAAKRQSEEQKLQDHPLMSSMLKGVEMTLRHFEQTLDFVGVQSIPTLGQNFDPTVHEALSQSSKPDAKDNEVIGEIQKGFQLNGRVIRPAKVVINKVQN